MVNFKVPFSTELSIIVYWWGRYSYNQPNELQIYPFYRLHCQGHTDIKENL